MRPVKPAGNLVILRKIRPKLVRNRGASHCPNGLTRRIMNSERLTDPVPDNRAVYVVDDTADYRFLVQQVFTHFLPQYSVRLFTGGDALLRELQTSPERPALILLDLYMPELSGQQTLGRLKQEPAWRSIPVVVVTSASSAQEVRACYQAGANSCLPKPVGLEAMRQHLEQLCTYWCSTNRPTGSSEPGLNVNY